MKKLKILVACEESQAVTIELRKLGHEAYSCDILECSGGHPEWHIQGDITMALYYHEWDLIGLHLPCTKVAVSGNRWYGTGTAGYNERIKSVKWMESVWVDTCSVCGKVYLENPVGVINSIGECFPKPQYVQPWQFGHGETKKTGLWLYGLPELEPTNIVEGRKQRIWKMPPSVDRAKLRSKTFSGIANAMANQWGASNAKK